MVFCGWNGSSACSSGKSGCIGSNPGASFSPCGRNKIWECFAQEWNAFPWMNGFIHPPVLQRNFSAQDAVQEHLLTLVGRSKSGNDVFWEWMGFPWVECVPLMSSRGVHRMPSRSIIQPLWEPLNLGMKCLSMDGMDPPPAADSWICSPDGECQAPHGVINLPKTPVWFNELYSTEQFH